MATFEIQIDALTGIGTGNATTQGYMNDWLADGARQVINIFPMNQLDRMSIQATFDATSSYAVEDAKILHVLRKDENNSDILMPCREIHASQSGRAADSNYMEYASSSDPAYYVQNKRLYILPASGTSNGSIIKINEDFTIDCTDTVTPGVIEDFPKEGTNAVVLFATRNALQYLMNAKQSSVSALNISDLSISGSSPVSPSISTVTYSNATNADASSSTLATVSVDVVPAKIDVDTNAPTYTKPSLTLTTLGLPDLSITASAPSDINVSAASVSFSQAVPSFTPPVLTVDVSQFETFLETDEDTELAQLQLGRLNNEVNQYQANIQNEIATFNEGVEVYRAELQKAIKDAELTSASEAQKIQEYSNDIQKYATNVNKEVTEYQQNTQKELNIYSTKVRAEIDKFRADIQNELNEFNKENAKYAASIQGEIQKHNTDLQALVEQARIDLATAQENARLATQVDIANKAQDQALAIQNAIQTMQSVIADNNSELSKFSQDINLYQADIAKQIQEYNANLQQKVQEFQSSLSIATVEYSWYEKQYAMIDAQYKEALQILSRDIIEIEEQKEKVQ